MTQFKDLFSKQASVYAQFRPHYPAELFKYLSELTPGHDLAWDCGTGNGQAAHALKKYFKKIIATDPSEKQLSQAKQDRGIEFSLGAEENSKLKDESVDLVTVAQAFHWFNQQRFFSECERVLKPKGVLAIWSYNLAKISDGVDRIVNYLYEEILRNYWEKERALVDEGYASVQLPFRKIQPPKIEMTAEWSLDHLLGYLNTWSAVQAYMKKNGKNPLSEVEKSLSEVWGTGPKKVTWPLTLFVSSK